MATIVGFIVGSFVGFKEGLCVSPVIKGNLDGVSAVALKFGNPVVCNPVCNVKDGRYVIGFVVGIDVGFKDEKIDGVSVGSIAEGSTVGYGCGLFVGYVVGYKLGSYVCSVIEVSRIAFPHKSSMSFAIVLKSAWKGCILTL